MFLWLNLNQLYKSSSNTEVLICGDYNINLLKLTGEAHFSDFFEMMLGHSYYPKITLPTRLNNSSGATLIENIFCKLSPYTVNTCAGIILDQLSDHYPYFVSLDNLSIKKNYTTKASKANDKQFRGNEKYVELHGI